METKYSIGDEVQSVSDPSRIGTVVQLGPKHAGVQYYRVHFGMGQRPMVAELDLRPYVASDMPFENLKAGNLGGYQEFQRLITYQRLLRDRPLRNNIYAFNASRTRFLPYQFRPLLKFLDSPRHRLLIADEVGLGKTIEAGLILTELRARQNVRRVLVVCPANLTPKWRLELRLRFGEDFSILTAQGFLQFLDDYEESPDRITLNGIISLESIRRDSILDRLDALAPDFDLVIVDEAHHMRNFGRKQRRAGVLLGRTAGAMLLLTATPVHLGNENLFSLLNILDDEDFPDLWTVNTRFQSNESIVWAQICLGQLPPRTQDAIKLLEQTAKSHWFRENPMHAEVLSELEELEANLGNETKCRRLQLQAQRNLAELNLIGHVFTRTRKREVQENTAQRKAFSLRLMFTENEQRFYNAVTHYVREESQRRTDSPVIQQWMLNMPQRRMASSIPAMVEHYQTYFGLDPHDLPDGSSLSEDNDSAAWGDNADLESARKRLRDIVAQWPRNGPDSKYKKFIDMLRQLRRNEGPCKIMVFAFFKDTLKYLARRLREDGFGCALISGDVPPDERPEIIEKFRTDPTVEVLLSSRVGSEGLDFQFCNTLFNYDLPWNPMEVEQRIGRLDRIGQESPVIRIYNFWIEGTIEQRMLERLYERIDIFVRSVGELEMILGDEWQALERDLLAKDLTPQEEQKRIDRTTMIVEARLTELEKLESESARFIGTDQYFEEEVQMIRDRRRYITGEQLRRFLADFIRNTCPRTHIEYDSTIGLGRFYPDEQLRSFISRHEDSSQLSAFLGSSNQGVAITFDSQIAFNNLNVEFINILHPLTRAISKEYKEKQYPLPNAHHVVLHTTRLKPGFYFYFIFCLKVLAARESNTLEMILLSEDLEEACSSEETEALMGEMVEQGETPRGLPLEIDLMGAQSAYEKARMLFLDRVAEIRQQLERNNGAFVDRRLDSLRAFYKKNITKQRDLLARGKAENRQERYLRMLRGTIARLERELAEKTSAHERLRAIEVNYDEIAAGVLEVFGESTQEK